MVLLFKCAGMVGMTAPACITPERKILFGKPAGFMVFKKFYSTTRKKQRTNLKPETLLTFAQNISN
jgi:hypothetical protein